MKIRNQKLSKQNTFFCTFLVYITRSLLISKENFTYQKISWRNFTSGAIGKNCFILCLLVLITNEYEKIRNKYEKNKKRLFFLISRLLKTGKIFPLKIYISKEIPPELLTLYFCFNYCYSRGNSMVNCNIDFLILSAYCSHSKEVSTPVNIGRKCMSILHVHVHGNRQQIQLNALCIEDAPRNFIELNRFWEDGVVELVTRKVE